MDELRFQHSGYLSSIRLDVRKTTVEAAYRRLRGLNFDSIAFSGMSGALVAPSLATEMQVQIIMVRKAQDTDNHSGYQVEGYIDSERYIFVDDCVYSGRTFDHVREQIKKFSPKAQCVGFYTYLTDVYTDTEINPWRSSTLSGEVGDFPKNQIVWTPFQDITKQMGLGG